MLRMVRLGGFMAAALLSAPLAAAELVMVEARGCVWCQRWNAEIAPAYPKTDEGRFAPLRRIDSGELPGDLEPARAVRFTPTFLIVEDGRELARIEGYPGEEFFWPVLARLLQEHTAFEHGETD